MKELEKNPQLPEQIADLNVELRGLVVSIIQSVERLLSEKLTLKEVLDAILTDEADGSAGRVVNVLEHGTLGPCLPVLLARCQIRPPNARPMHSVMRQVREHLLRCLDTTRVVILLTDHWNPQDLDESRGDLRVHASRAPGTVILPILVSNSRLHPLAFEPDRR